MHFSPAAKKCKKGVKKENNEIVQQEKRLLGNYGGHFTVNASVRKTELINYYYFLRFY